MRIVMVGSGYVGLVSGVCFADFGHDVICVDKDPDKIRTLNAGEIPIFEPGLDALVSSNIEAGRLCFSTDLAASMVGADAVFIAVGTPSRRGDGHADLSYVYAACQEIADNINKFTVVITKSTVPVGTGDEVEALMRKRLSADKFAVVSNPEFLREGAAINDFKSPDRVVIGTDDLRAREVMRKLYRPLSVNNTPLVFTSRRTSELIKYAANAFLATKITFINEMADLCEAVGGNIQEVAHGIGLDKRIGRQFLQAGPGYGGSCFPKDTLALVNTAKSYAVDLSIVDAVVLANTARKTRMAAKLIAACGGSVKDKRIAVLGLAFKPNTDDMRDAPSLTIVPHLQEHGAKIIAFDPEAMDEAAKLLTNVTFVDNPYECVKDADATLIITEWDQICALNIDRVKSLMACPIIVDLRNIFHPEDMTELGMKYTCIGHPKESKL